MRIINKDEYKLIDDRGGLLIFRHRRFPDDYIAVKECKIFDKKLGYARVLTASSSLPEGFTPLREVVRVICSAASD